MTRIVAKAQILLVPTKKCVYPFKIFIFTRKPRSYKDYEEEEEWLLTLLWKHLGTAFVMFCFLYFKHRKQVCDFSFSTYTKYQLN